MLRLVNSFNLLKVSVESINSSFTNLQTVRWRKPRWIPKAKSKIFRVNKRPVIPEDEQKELLRLHNNYRTHIKSIRRYLTLKYNTMYQVSLDPEEILRLFKEDLEKCSAINDEWNSEQKVQREKRLAEKLEHDIEFAKKRIDLELIKEEKTQEFLDEMVKKEKEASKLFITLENIDEVIDKAVTHTSDYNYAIDNNGEKIVGRETKANKEDPKVSVKQ